MRGFQSPLSTPVLALQKLNAGEDGGLVCAARPLETIAHYFHCGKRTAISDLTCHSLRSAWPALWRRESMAWMVSRLTHPSTRPHLQTRRPLGPKPCSASQHAWDALRALLWLPEPRYLTMICSYDCLDQQLGSLRTEPMSYIVRLQGSAPCQGLG